MKQYCVVNMDIVGSRNVKDRNKLQLDLKNYINYINQKYKGILVSPVTITLGDEWQLITDVPSESYNLVHEFQQFLWKDSIELYAGIGIGELKTPIFEDIRMMDGPCFHIARQAINIAKNLNKYKTRYNINKLNKVFLIAQQINDNFNEEDILNVYFTPKTGYVKSAMQEVAAASEIITGNTCNDSIDKFLMGRTINLIIENNEVLKAKMTRKQKEIYVSYQKLGSYRKVISNLQSHSNETIGGISQKLNVASYFTIQRNHQIVSILLGILFRMGE